LVIKIPEHARRCLSQEDEKFDTLAELPVALTRLAAKQTGNAMKKKFMDR